MYVHVYDIEKKTNILYCIIYYDDVYIMAFDLFIYFFFYKNIIIIGMYLR